MAKLIGLTIHSYSNVNDDAMYEIEKIVTLVEKALPINRTTMMIAASMDETHVSLDGDEDFNEGQVTIFAIIEADEEETLEDAEKAARELIRDELHDQFKLSGLKQKKLF